MQRYPQKTDPEEMTDNRDRAVKFIERQQPNLAQARAEQNASMFKVLGTYTYKLAVYSYVFEEPPVETVRLLRETDAQHATAWEFGLVVTVYDYLHYLALAVVSGDDAFAKRLAEEPRQRYENPGAAPEEVTFLTAEILAALVLDRTSAASGRVAAAQGELTGKKVAPFDLVRTQGLVAMAAAALAGDQGAFDKAVEGRQADFKKIASPAAVRNSPESLLDIQGLAFLRLAQKRGMRYQGASVYWPTGLFQGTA